jgi:SPP1 family predicted phage head-tail adaptor
MRKVPVLIQQKTTVPDALGEAVETWSTYHTVYASIDPITGREHSLGTALQNLSEVTYVATCRDDPAVRAANSTMRIQWDGRTLYIAAVLTGTQPGEARILLQERPLQS